MRTEGTRYVQLCSIASDRRRSDGEPYVRRVLGIGHDRIDVNVGLAAEMYEKVARLEMAFHIEHSRCTLRSAHKTHRAVEVYRNRSAASLAVFLESKRLQRPVEFGEVMRLKIHLQISEWI